MNKEKEINSIKKCVSELVYEKDKLKKAYNYYHCRRDPEQFKHLEDNYGLGTPTDVNFTPIIKKHIDVLVGEYLELDQDLQISCKDEETLSNILRDKQLKITSEVKKFYDHYLNNAILNLLVNGKQNIDDPFIKAEIEKIKISIENGFVSEYEKAAQNILSFVKNSRDIDLKNKMRELLTDLLISGTAYYDVRPTRGNKGLNFIVCNPLDTFIERNPNYYYLNKSPRAVVRRWLTRDQILAEYGDVLDSDAKAKITNNRDKHYEGNSGYVTRGSEAFLLRTGSEPRGILGGLEAVPFFNNTNDVSVYTSSDRFKVYECQWLEIDKDEVMQRHRGVQIESDIFICYGIDENAPRSISKPNECELSINGIFFNDKNGYPQSMILNTMDLQDKYDMLLFYRDNLIASSGTVGDWIDIAHLPSVLGESFEEVILKWKAYKKQGIALYDSSQEGTQMINTSFNGFNDSLKADAIQAIQLAIQDVEQQVSSITGVFAEKLGGIQQRDAVSNVKVGIRQSTLLTKQYFFAMDCLYKEVNYDMLNLAKIVYKDGLQGVLILGPKQHKIFTALPEHYTMTDFDIHLKDSTEVYQAKETINMLGIELVKSGQADAEMAVKMALSKNITELTDYVERAIASKKKENDQIGQLTQQLEEAQKQMKEYEKQISQMQENADKLQREIQKNSSEKLALEKQNLSIQEKKVDNDKDTDDKLAKLKERQLELEWLQIHDGNPYNDKIKDV